MIPRMRIISKLTVLLGVLLAFAGVIALIWAGWVSYQRFLALDALRSADVATIWVQMLAAGVGLPLGGFLIGLGVGKTPKKAPADPATPPVAEG
jgi:hypothetical protein